ncbi:MAG: serine/threonine protein kinase [Gallionellales bacterium GWA2_55_18]|nr:MAG: serine/threonine protein kinase [Gallionellales bacterium GWA2_55_18]
MDKIGKYEVVRELGAGATSTVYLANDPFSKQPVAIKLINLKTLHDSHQAKIFRKLLMTEASLAGKLSHPHIVKILDAAMEEDINYIVMEYVEGSTLEQFAEVENLLPISTVAEITYKCCKALEYAQNQGVIHRDIKPANILLQGETDIKIADFGAAVIQTDRSATQVVGIGSPAYMSPEQIEELELTHQTDIYSLGVVMYKLLTGKLPFDTDSHVSTVYHILNVDPPPPSSLRRDVPPEMDTIVRHAMEKKTSQRYQTWYEFSRDLVVFFKHAVPDQKEIYDTEKFDTLRSLAFFENFSDVELWDVLRISKWRRASDSEQILHEGESGRSFYVLAQGTVRVVKQGKWLCLLHRGDCFGEMAHLADQDFRRSADVIAKNDVVLIEISPDALASATTGCRFQFVDAFLHILVKRLTAATNRISFLEAE